VKDQRGCFNCGKEGHKARDCDQEKKSAPEKNVKQSKSQDKQMVEKEEEREEKEEEMSE